MKRTFEFEILIALVVLLLILAPSARSQEPAQTDQLEKVKLITSIGIDNFVKDLNENGKSGYRLENSLNYGGEGLTQGYGASRNTSSLFLTVRSASKYLTR